MISNYAVKYGNQYVRSLPANSTWEAIDRIYNQLGNSNLIRKKFTAKKLK